MNNIIEMNNIEQIIITVVLFVWSWIVTCFLFRKGDKNKIKFMSIPSKREGEFMYTTDLIVTKDTKFFTRKEFFGNSV